MTNYIALMRKTPDSDYSVDFPDLPGCITAGRSLDEAREMAAEALALHLEGMADAELAVPEPSSLEAVMADPENRDAVAFLVPAPAGQDKAVRVNITLPERTLAEIDRYTRAHGTNRSAFLAEAARRVMAAE